MMKAIQIFFLVLLFTVAKAQNQQGKIDSLENWIKKYPKKDTVWVKNLIELERQYYIHDPDRAGLYANTIINSSKKLNYFFGIARGYTVLIQYYIKKGDYPKAMNTAFEKLKFLEKEKSTNFIEISSVYSFLGYIYYLVGNQNENALKYYKLAYEYGLKRPLSDEGRSKGLAGHLSNMALVYTRVENYQQSLASLMEANKIAQKIPLKDDNYYYLLSTIQINIANNYYFIYRYDLSNKYLLQALSLTKENKINITLNRVYLALIRNYIELKQFDKAKEYYVFIKNMYDRDELVIDDKALFLKFTTQLAEGERNFEKAYLSLKREDLLKDSLNKEEQKKIINELTIKYESEKKEQENKLLQAKNAQVNTRNQLYLVAIFSVIGLLLLSAGFYYQLRKKNKNLDTLNQVKDRLFSIIAHDLKRPAIAFQNVVESFDYLIKKQQYDRLHQMGLQAQTVSSDMNLIIDNLFRWALAQQDKNSVVIEKVNIAPIIQDMIAEFNAIVITKQLQVAVDMPLELYCKTDKTLLSSVIRNVLSNAIKFTPQHGKIEVTSKMLDNQLIISIKDTGIGIPDKIQKQLFTLDTTKSRKGTNGEQGAGLGLLLCKELIELVNGTIGVESQEGIGTTVTIRLTKRNENNHNTTEYIQ